MDKNEVKSRGKKHVKDKKKYKDNTTKNPKHVPPKMVKKVDLGSNWDRYEVDEGETTSTLSVSTNFEVLATAPITVGSHFQFKKDQLTIDEEVVENSLFTLNLDQLHYSMLSIPFYQRIGIDEDCFKVSHIKEMKDSSARNVVFYKEYLEKHPKILENPVSSECLEESDNNDIVSEVTILNEGADSKLELEEWLDDILDE